MCLLAVAALAASAILLTAAVLTPAPLPVLPLLLVVCLGCPLALSWTLPESIAALRWHGALRGLRRELASLPEAPHPHGF